MATEKKQPKCEVKVEEPSPIPRLCLMAVFLSGIADVIAQNTDLLASFAGASSAKAVFKLDLARLARFIFYGVFMTPIGFKWVSLLNYLFPMPESKVIKTSEKTEKVIEPSTVDVFQAVTKRVIMDQVVYSPFSVAFFFVGMGYLEGSNWVEIYSKLTENFWPALIACYKVWPLVQFFNFFFVPLVLQIPFCGFVGIFWNIYMSLLNSQ